MSYSGNLPDWHQFNPPQHGRTGTSSSQNVNTSHLFLPGINPPALDTINLTTNDRSSKHPRNDVGYGGRNYQPSTMPGGPTCGTNSSSSVHMGALTGCVGHYGSSPSRNPMMDSIAGAIDPRIPPVGPLNETDLPHRTNQISFNPAPTNHAGTSNIPPGIHGGMPSQTSPVGPMSPGRQGGPYGACKGPCCNPDTNISYSHWDKYSHYPPNPHYRDSMRSAATYPTENRRYMPDMTLRKDCIENKELGSHGFGVENRRNYTDYKYRKELSRNYPTSSGLLQNYPMQNFNFPTDYQKCPYSVKDYVRRSSGGSSSGGSSGSASGSLINHQNSGIMKYPEHQNINVQQKYNSKQLSYANSTLPSGISNSSSSNIPSPLQNSYFNPSQLPPRDVTRDFPRDYPEPTATVSNRLPTSPTAVLHGSYQKYHVYQQKIAMQRYSIENHLRAMSRIPGYQSHPKYQEYMMRYREVLRLQQNVDYQGMLQETPKIPSPSSAPPIPPINLQFDQNGVLINSTYNPSHFPGLLNSVNPLGTTDSIDNPDVNRINMNRSLESQNQSLNLSRDSDNNINHRNDKNQESYLIQKSDATDFENLIVNVDDLDVSPVAATVLDVPARTGTIENNNSKEFADKPELDVRQFLANWDETEDEEALVTTYPAIAINRNNNPTNNNDNSSNNQNINNNNNNKNNNIDDYGDNNNNNNNGNRIDGNNCSNNIHNNTHNNNNNSNTNTSISLVTTNSTSQAINVNQFTQQQLKQTNNSDNNSNHQTVVDAGIIVQSNIENIGVENLQTIEELANTSTIVQCIQTDTDDVPTIHIVDHLPDDSELATIQTVYGDVTSLTIEQIAKAPIEIINETSQGTETITLFEPDSGVCIKLPECDNEPVDIAAIDGKIVVEEVVASIIDASVEITELAEQAQARQIMSNNNNETNHKSTAEDAVTTPTNLKFSSPNEQVKIQNLENTANKDNHNFNRLQASNLKKQHSFANEEESHNPDDISLPDLPMSECTPISTTLNTPIHSDSEESSGRVADLSISTNPIEIIQNSPIISFTHSPIKINPYENLENVRLSEKRPEDSLDFDFHDNNNSSINNNNNNNNNKGNNDDHNIDNSNINKTTVENFEIAKGSTPLEINARHSNIESKEQHKVATSVNSNSLEQDKLNVKINDEFYPSCDPLVGMTQRSENNTNESTKNTTGIVDISNDMMPIGECSVESLGVNTISETAVSKILSSDEIDISKYPSIINTEDFQHSDDLDKLCNISLDDSCIMPLMAGESSRESRLRTSIDDQSFSKVIQNILPISDINVLQSSDDEPLDKEDDDWIEVKSLPGSPVNSDPKELANTVINGTVELLNKQRQHSNEFDKSVTYSRDSKKNIENYNISTHTLLQYTSGEKHNSTSDNYLRKSTSDEKRRKNYVPSIFDIPGDSQSTDFDKFERKRQEKNKKVKTTGDYSKNNDKLFSSIDKNVDNNLNSKENSCVNDLIKYKTAYSSRNGNNNNNNNSKKLINNDGSNLQSEKSFESISDALKALENYEMCTVSKSYCHGHKDTDVQIQVANINVKDQSDGEGSEDMDAIEIKINVSRSDKSHSDSKQLRDKLTEEVSEVIRKHTYFPLDTTITGPRKIFNHRRTSMPDELESKKPNKFNECDRRRNSGGHYFKIFHRKSIDEQQLTANDNKKFHRYFDTPIRISQSSIAEETVIDNECRIPTSFTKTLHQPDQDNLREENITTSVFGNFKNDTNIDNILNCSNRSKELMKIKPIDEFNTTNDIITELCDKKKNYDRKLLIGLSDNKQNTLHCHNKCKNFPRRLSLDDLENQNSSKLRIVKKEEKRRISLESAEDHKNCGLRSKKIDCKRGVTTTYIENDHVFDCHRKNKDLIRRLSLEDPSSDKLPCEFGILNKNFTRRLSIDMVENEINNSFVNKKDLSTRRPTENTKLMQEEGEDEDESKCLIRKNDGIRRSSVDKSKSLLLSNIDDFDNLMSKSSCDVNLAVSDTSLIDNFWNKSNFLENTSSFDFDNFDITPNESSFINFTSQDNEDGISSRMNEDMRNRRLEDSERYRNPYSNAKPVDVELTEMNLNSVPVYATKDGKITYSLNPKYTYRKLIQQARRKEGHSLIQDLLYSKLLKDYYERKLYRRCSEFSNNEKCTDRSPKKSKQSSSYYLNDVYNENQRWEDEEWEDNDNKSSSKLQYRWQDKDVLEYEELTDNQSMIYTDTSAPLGYSPVESLFQYQHRKYSLMMPFNRKTDNYYQKNPSGSVRQSDGSRLDWDRAINNNVIDSPLTSHNHEDMSYNIDETECNKSRLFNESDLDLISQNINECINHDYYKLQQAELEMHTEPIKLAVDSRIEQKIDEKVEDNNLDERLVIQENEIRKIESELAIPESIDPGLTDEDSKDVSSIATNATITKPTGNVDIEQDSRAMLTDSGVESSTTYVDGCKGSRKMNKLEKWQSPYTVCPVENITFKENQPNEKRESFFINNNNNNNNLQIQEKMNSPLVNTENNMNVLMIDNSNHDNNKKISKLIHNTQEQELIIDTNNEKLVPKGTFETKLDKLFAFKNNLTDFDSKILKGLDLAYPRRQLLTKGVQVDLDVDTTEENSDTRNLVNDKFLINNDQQSSSFLGVKKSTEGPIRRVSSDEIEKRKEESRRNIFFEDISSFTNNTRMTLSVGVNTNTDYSLTCKTVYVEKNNKLIKINNECPLKECGTVLHTNQEAMINLQNDFHIFEKPEVPSLRFQSYNSDVEKPPETESNQISTESEVSQYVDTLSSTQFGSECAESESIDETSNIGINFLSTSSQEAIDATDLKQVRKNLSLCTIDDHTATKAEEERKETDNIYNDEHTSQVTTGSKLEGDYQRPALPDKPLIFSGRISSESEDDSNALDYSPIGEAQINNINTKIDPNVKDKFLSFSGKIPESLKSLLCVGNSLIHTDEIVDDRQKNTDKPLNFSGRIPSPENRMHDFPSQPDANLNPTTGGDNNDDKNKTLTFSGKIANDKHESIKKPLLSDKIPKFIIKKTDHLSTSTMTTIATASSMSQVLLSSDVSKKSVTDIKRSSSNKISLHPKIPKMIIRNVKSWPETPTIEENAVELSFPKTTYEDDDKVFEVKIKLDDKKQHESRDSIKKSIGVIECKVPKMKIKLDDRQPKMIFENASMELYSNDSESMNNLPKLKIRKIKRSTSGEDKSHSTIKLVKNSDGNKPDRHTKDKSIEITRSPESKHKVNKSTENDQHIQQERIPKLKIKKQDTRISLPHGESSRKKRPKSPDILQKSSKKSLNKHRNPEVKINEKRSSSVDKESTTNSHQSVSEKVPKVIIKRTSSSSEFKCELSKDGGDAIKRDVKWQPEVKLERFQVLDSIAKEPGTKTFPVDMLEIISKQTKELRASKCSRRSQMRTSSDPSEKNKFSEELISSKYKRRHSDSDKPKYQLKESVIKILNEDSDSEDFPRIKRRDFSRRIKDDSSQDEIFDIKSEVINESKNVISKDTTSIKEDGVKSSTINVPQTQEIARPSEYNYLSLNYNQTSDNIAKRIADPVSVNDVNATISVSDIKNSVIEMENIEEPESVIKLESSDESQTTIEILPASPEISRLESDEPMPLEGKCRIANGDLAQLYPEDAIPTQFELELEIVDNSSDSLDVPVPSLTTNPTNKIINCSTTYADAATINDDPQNVWICPLNSNTDKQQSVESSISIQHNHENQKLCCSDLLVKEVLAAKETLKRCLAKSKINSNCGFSARPKTAAEKKQGAAFQLSKMSRLNEPKNNTDHHNVFQKRESKSSAKVSNRDQSKSHHDKNDRKHSRSDKSTSSDKRDKKKSLSDSSSRRRDEQIRDLGSHDGSSSYHGSIKSLKRPRESNESGEFSNSNVKKTKSHSPSSSVVHSECSRSTASTSLNGRKHVTQKSQITDLPCSPTKVSNKKDNTKNVMLSKISESSTGSLDSTGKSVETMPVLEPQGHVNFNVNERDTSRSPPTITKQDGQQLNSESSKKIDNQHHDKIELINKECKEDVSFADIVMQMAYHEKATIKHKRYCPLCERWFPTTERHRRHLDGYQHRHTELTQRRTVHALFMMFTGKPCPRLLPASIVRTDCVPGEPTPLQIAVQDVAISLEKGTDKKKTVDDEDKK